eukprot:2877946-Rhodomonas_salina.4
MILMTGCYLMRTAIKESMPSARIMMERIMMDIIKPDAPMPRSSRVAAIARSAMSMFVPANRQCIKINTTGNDNFVALMGTLQVIAMQQSYAFQSTVMAPEPKTQSWALRIVYVPKGELPDSTTLIPTKFGYKGKFDENCNVIRKKGRLCVHGDLQKDCKFTETFAPTLHCKLCNTLRALMSVAVQEKLKLVQSDIKGAFMVSLIDDKDIYISLPDGYKVLEGYTAKLSNSLYCTHDTAFRFWSTLSTWMIESGFEPVNADKTSLRLRSLDDTVDNRSLPDEAYAAFVKELATRFKLSAKSKKVTWYLGVGLQRDWKAGTLKLMQEQYIIYLLKRFNLTDCNQVLTPMEVGHRFSSLGCPDTLDKANVKEYQQL